MGRFLYNVNGNLEKWAQKNAPFTEFSDLGGASVKGALFPRIYRVPINSISDMLKKSKSKLPKGAIRDFVLRGAAVSGAQKKEDK